MNRSDSILLRPQRRTRKDAGERISHHRSAAAARKTIAAVLACAALGGAAAAMADDSLPPVSIGAGMRGSFDVDTPDTGPKSDDFNLDDVRLYVNGSVTSNIKFMFNTDYSQGTGQVQVIDAAAQFSWSDEVNIWAGRFLPPSDRANLYGPYYANQWSVYQDGVQDGYASVAVGRDDGVMYWGQFGILKVSAGVFDVPQTKGSSKVVWAQRAQLDFWDPENGYYLNGTYYGDKDILAIGAAGQEINSNQNAYSADFLMEKKLPGGGMFGVEAEYAKYEGDFGGYAGDESDGAYGLVDYLFPQVIGIGKVQILAKYAKATYDFYSAADVGQKTKDFEINYIMKEFNARVSLYYEDFTYDQQGPTFQDHKMYGLGLQLQM